MRLQIARMVAAIGLVMVLSSCITIQTPPDGPSDQPEVSAPVETNSSSTELNDESSAQQVDFSITGGCQESYEELGYYAIFEEFEDDCYLIVEVFPIEPARTANLQFFDQTWETESTGTTDSGGVVYLEVDPLCDDGFWCDGVWEYRVTVEPLDAYPAERSPVFELDFIPYS